MQIGDFVKGKPNNGYGITNEDMTKGIVVDVLFNDHIMVKVLDHMHGGTGTHRVKTVGVEVIGHQNKFDRSKVLELLKSGCKKAILDYNLSSANLSGANLSNADLSNAYLRGADLSNADLSSANLSGANLSGANLSNANLSNADLRGAYLRSADLSSANLSGANLSNADLSSADLRGADLGGADLRGADLRSADLSGADLRSANLRGANLSGADLRGADLDLSCLPLRCGGLKWKIDKRIACQLAYHLCSMQCDDEEYLKMRDSILEFANQFHRVDECGRLNPQETF